MAKKKRAGGTHPATRLHALPQPLQARARATTARMACTAAPAGAVDASAAYPGAQDAACCDITAGALRSRLLSYFRDTAEGEPGGAEADPLQARAPRPALRCAGADVSQVALSRCSRAWGSRATRSRRSS